jgi:hypothetical protein
MCRIRLSASKFVQYFLKRTLCLICRIPFVNRDGACQSVNRINRVYYYEVKLFSEAQKGKCFLDDFEALVREIDVRALVPQNGLRITVGREMSF